MEEKNPGYCFETPQVFKTIEELGFCKHFFFLTQKMITWKNVQYLAKNSLNLFNDKFLLFGKDFFDPQKTHFCSKRFWGILGGWL